MISPLTADQAEIQITDRYKCYQQTLIYIYINSYFPKTSKDWNNLSLMVFRNQRRRRRSNEYNLSGECVR
jgi:hypothetical protein